MAKKNGTKNKEQKMKNEEIVVMPKSDIVIAKPGRGFEEADNQDLILPQAKLMQGLSPELKENRELRQGDIINSLTKELIGKFLIPVFTFKNYARFNPRKEDDPNFNPKFKPGGLIWRTNDPFDPRVIAEAAWGEDGSQPVATTFLNFMCYFPGFSLPIVVSFSRSSYKAGRRFLTLTKAGGGDMFSRVYELCAKEEKNDKGEFYTFNVKPVGLVDNEKDMKIAEAMYQTYAPKAKNIVVDIETNDE